MSVPQLYLRNRVVQFLEAQRKVRSDWKAYTVSHFTEEGFSRPTIYRTISTYLARGSVEHGKGAGRPVKIMTPGNKNRLRRAVNNTTGVSQNRMAAKFGCSQPYISKTLKNGYRNPIKCRKRVKTPLYKSEQVQRTKGKCRKLYDHTAQKLIVMDDEKYFGLTGYQMTGNLHYYSSDSKKAPIKVKTRAKSKFEPKVLLWIAISEKGISTPTILNSQTGMSINQDVYMEKCLLPNLLPFLDGEPDHIFWPDLARAHYAKRTLDFLELHNVNVVPKDMNPPNMPQCRPIEDFFGALATNVYDKNWVAADVGALERRLRSCVAAFPVEVVQRLMKTTRKKLRASYTDSIYAACH